MAWLLVACGALAQNYSIDWSKIAGGGGTATGGVYMVSGTTGQHDAGSPLTGGNFSVTGGYWSFLSAVQTPGAPILSIQVVNSTTAIVSWPDSSTAFKLQQKATLNPGGTNWTTVTNSVNTVGGQNQVTISPLAGSHFFRLKYP